MPSLIADSIHSGSDCAAALPRTAACTRSWAVAPERGAASAGDGVPVEPADPFEPVGPFEPLACGTGVSQVGVVGVLRAAERAESLAGG